jgi:hypothetical protein
VRRARVRFAPARSAAPDAPCFAFCVFAFPPRVRSRPKNVGEVACQEEVVATLSKSIETANVRARAQRARAHTHARMRTHAKNSLARTHAARSPPLLALLRICAALRTATPRMLPALPRALQHTPTQALPPPNTRTRKTRTRPNPNARFPPRALPFTRRSCRTCCSTALPAPARPAPRWPSRVNCTALSF